MIGLGASTIVPIVFSSAGNLPGVNPSVGIAFATSVGYLGLFFGPPTIGFLSDLFNLRLAFLFSLTLMLILFTLVVFRLHKMKVE
jgi:MFS family permease